MATSAEQGVAISCVMGMDPTGRLVSGRRAILEAVARRWITPKGRYGPNGNYGYCVADNINDDVGPRELEIIRQRMIQQAMEDDRVLSCTIEIIMPPRGTGKYVFRAALEDAEGPFPATFELTRDNVLSISLFQET